MLRAAGRVIGFDRIIVVGSQAVLATVAEFMLPLEATMSVEADLIPLDGTEASADKIDGASLAHQARCGPTQGLRVLPSTGQSATDLSTHRSGAGTHHRCPCRRRQTRRTGRTAPRGRLRNRRAWPRRPRRACPQRAHDHGQHRSEQAQREHAPRCAPRHETPVHVACRRSLRLRSEASADVVQW